MRTTNIDNVGMVNIEGTPDKCPICHHAIAPLDIGQAGVTNEALERVFRCPRAECSHFFIARYPSARLPNGVGYYHFTQSVPFTLKKSDHSPTITDISPDFVAIFDQSEEAEQHGLTMVCGPAYRKSLEFLIKDYVIRSHEDNAEGIKKLFLGKCIAEYVTDGKVKQVAERAVWLGNDETHYVRKWEDKDLKDLKLLIRLTVHWIEMDEMTREILKDMPEGK